MENCIKPFKFEIDVEDGEGARGRENVALLLKKELKAVEDAVKNVEKEVGGRRRLKDVVAFVEKCRKGETVVEGDGASGAGGFSKDLLQKGLFFPLPLSLFLVPNPPSSIGSPCLLKC